jgi:oligopeptide transport system permease protein
MAGYALRRLLIFVPLLWFVATVTFLLMHAVPGGPFDRDSGHGAATNEILSAKYGLDQPLPEQYGRFLAHAVRGDLGISFQSQDRSVRSVIGDGLRPTLVLGALAGAYAIVLGLLLGIIGARYAGRWPDRATSLVATAAASIPGFVFGILLVALFSLKLEWTPVLGWGSPSQAVLPVITLGSFAAAYLGRVSRAALLDVLHQDYVRTARAKGLSGRTVWSGHVLRNALVPVLAVSGPIIAALVTGSFIVEQLFAIPGIGRAFVQAVLARDYGMIMGTTIFYAAVIAAANLAVDLLYGVVDPRARST